MKNLKWHMIVMSVAYLLLGAFLIAEPGTALTVVCYALGAVVLGNAVVQLIRYFTAERGVWRSQLTLVFALVSLALGGFLIVRSDIVVSILPVVFGLFVLFDSIGRIQSALELRRCQYANWWSFLLLGLLSIVLGAIMIFNPFATMATLVMAIGVILCIEGALNLISALYTALAVKRFMKTHPAAQAVLENLTGEDLNGDGIVGGDVSPADIEGVAVEVASEEADDSDSDGSDGDD